MEDIGWSRKYLFVILSLMFFILLFFVKSSLSQVQWDDVRIYLNVHYSPESSEQFNQSNAHLLDLYRPENCQFCPVIVYIHGGTWVLGDKGGLSYKAKAFTDHDYIYISINYRLSPDYLFPAHAYDVANAFSWIKKNIEKYGGNPERIYLLGHSAGGHLAALIALDPRYLKDYNLAPADIAGIIGLDSAAYHLPSLFADEPENQFLFSWTFGDNIQNWEEASPVHYIKEGLNIPPFLLLVAGDREISKTVNQTFYQQLIKNCYDATILYFEDKNHVSIDYDLGKEDDNIFPMVLGWLNQHQQYE